MNSASQKSPAGSTPSPKAKGGNPSNTCQVPYETYLRMSKEERAKIPYDQRPYHLTPDEIESLRKDAKAAAAKADFRDLFK